MDFALQSVVPKGVHLGASGVQIISRADVHGGPIRGSRLHTRQRVVRAGAMTNLNTKVWLSLAVLAIVIGLLLFVPAWTVH
jgi:hypothetical protein